MDVSYIVVLVSISISVISALAVIITYLISKEIQSLDGIKLVIILECINLCCGLVVYLPTPLYLNNGIMCDIQGVLLQTFEVSEVLWTGFMSAQLYWGLKNRDSSYFSLTKGLLLIISIAFTTAIIPLALDIYSSTGDWCFIGQSYEDDYTTDILLRFLLFYGLLWTIFISSIILNAKSVKIFRNNSEKQLKNVYSMVRYYPIGMIICYLPQTILRMLECIHDIDIPIEYYMFAYFMSRLIGFVDALIFISTDKIKKMACNRKLQDANISMMT